MMIRRPHYLLLSEARRHQKPAGELVGSWRFVLESTDGKDRLDVTDEESEVTAERLELLSVVRGLEALDQPSRVTLITSSRYVHRGLRFGLPHWRRDAWTWEYDGQMIPVSNADLWRRMDGALQYHQLRCRRFRVDGVAFESQQHVVGAWIAARRGWWPAVRRWFRRAARPGATQPLRPAEPRWLPRPVTPSWWGRPIGASA